MFHVPPVQIARIFAPWQIASQYLGQGVPMYLATGGFGLKQGSLVSAAAMSIGVGLVSAGTAMSTMGPRSSPWPRPRKDNGGVVYAPLPLLAPA